MSLTNGKRPVNPKGLKGLAAVLKYFIGKQVQSMIGLDKMEGE